MRIFLLLLITGMWVRIRPDNSFEPADEYSVQMNNAAKVGIAKCSQCQNIGIIGAGVAGLTAALELALSGHNVTIFEGSNRVGGRILTYRNLTYGYMTELGAMRLPLDLHQLLGTYVDRLNLTRRIFINENDNAFIYLNDHSQRVSATHGAEDFGFQVRESEKGKSANDLWNEALAKLFQEIDLYGLPAFNKKYSSFTIEGYLSSINMSRVAIDFIALMLNLETSLSAALSEINKDRFILDQTFYSIQDGNDLLPTSLLKACLNVGNSNRCSIRYNARVTGVTIVGDKAEIIYTFSNGTYYANFTSPLYDRVIVATTAKAASLIDFNDRKSFIDLYRAMRQINYDCASRIALFFKYQWWKKLPQINIVDGRSTTDLLIRVVRYNNFNASASDNDGAAILASCTLGQDSLPWQSISDDDARALALENIDRLHAPNIRDFYTGGITKHWCADTYAHGAYPVFTPSQEHDVKAQLIAPVRNLIHVIGDHTSSLHGWVEGAVLSALRVLMQIQEETFDVAIVGGGPIGLLTAIQLAKQNSSMKIVIIEQFTIGNPYGASHDNVKQFRQPHSDRYLAELAMMSFSKWRELESDLGLAKNSILDTTHGFLFFGNRETPITTVEGNLHDIERNCIELGMNCLIMNNTQLRQNFRFFTPQLTNEGGIFHNDSGYINMTLLLSALRTTIETNYTNIFLRENESFLDLDQSVLDEPSKPVRLRTSRGSLNAKRIVFVPGPYAKNISATLGFDLNMTMWELPTLYFKLNSPLYPAPTWLFAGVDDKSLFNGYPIEATNRPGFIQISPEFIEFMEDPLIYPNDRRGRDLHFSYFITKAQEWISSYATYVDYNKYDYDNSSTCLATFVPDNGFIIDRIPSPLKYSSKVIMYAAGWGMKFAPVWADILSYFVLGTELTSPYAKYLPNFRLNIEGRIIGIITTTTTNTPVTSTYTTTSATISTTGSGTSPNRHWEIAGKALTGILAFGIVIIIIAVVLFHRYGWPRFGYRRP